MRNINLIVVHHSASSLDTTTEMIRVWHVIDNGWSNIGYHAVIEKDGILHPGRDITRVGAHARGANKGSLGICVVGNNLLPGRKWTGAQIATLGKTLEVWLMMFPGSKIAGHCDVGTTATACPGLDIRALFPRLSAVKPREGG